MDSGKEASRSLVVVPTKLPRTMLSSSELVRRGLFELAESESAIQKLPDLPVPLWGHAAVSDEANEQVLIIGGARNTSTWAFSFQDWQWHELCPAGPTEGLLYPAVAFDIARNRLISFGGWEGRVRPAVDDLLILDLEPRSNLQWRRVEPKGRWPEARYGASLAVGGDGKSAILFGGDIGGETSRMDLQADLWYLDLELLTWQLLLHCTRAWLKRRFHQSAFDSRRGRLVFFGGESAESFQFDEAAEPPMAVVTNVTPRERNWSAAKGRLTPGVAMAYVTEANAIVGVSDHTSTASKAGPSPNLWRYDLIDFRMYRRPLQGNVEVKPVQAQAMCYCRHRRSLFWAGGKSPRSVGAGRGRRDAYLVSLDALQLGWPAVPGQCCDRFGKAERQAHVARRRRSRSKHRKRFRSTAKKGGRNSP